jgi:hypothetical protein
MAAMLLPNLESRSAEYRKNPGAWLLRFGAAFAGGAVKQAIDDLNLVEQAKSIKQLLGLVWEALGQSDFGVRLLWTDLIDDPLIKALKSFLSGEVLSPELLGGIAGRVWFEVLAVVLMTVLEVLVSQGYAAQAAGAIAGTRLGMFVQRLAKTPRFLSALSKIQRVKSLVTSTRLAISLYRAAERVEATRRELEVFLRSLKPVALVVKDSRLWEALVGRELASLTEREIGQISEQVARRLLQENGYVDILAIQNRSGHGIDLLARGPDGGLRWFEVKGSTRIGIDPVTGRPDLSSVPRLSIAESDPEEFVRTRLERAADPDARHWRGYPASDHAKAGQILIEYERSLKEVTSAGGRVSHTILQVDLANKRVCPVPWVRR